MKKLLLILISIICSNASAQNTISGSFIHGSLNREYRLYVPASYSGAPVPLILNLHGYGSDMSQQEVYGDFRAIADTAGFIVVHPNGTFDTSFKRYWNAYGLSTVDDLGFLSALIDTISSSYSIDPNRIYSTGLSNGGIMSYYLACNLSSRITAIAPVAGTMTPQMKAACTPQHPTPVMHIHGTADAVVPYAGSSVFMHIDSVISYWRWVNSSDISPVITNVPNSNTSDGCTATRYDHNNGSAGTSVSLYKITNGGHTWPGAPVNVGVTNHDFSASAEIWKFFRKYSRNNLLSVPHNPVTILDIFPNPSSESISARCAKDGILNIYDMSGKQLYSISVREGQNNIETGKLEKGIYLLRLETSGSVFTTRFIKS